MADKLFRKDMTLTEMDAVLENYLKEHSTKVRILTDIPLTMGECDLLWEAILHAHKDMAMLQRYRLCILTVWAYSLHYGKAGIKYYRKILEELDGIPQYLQRQFLEVCESTFEDYGLNTYWISIRNKQELYSMMVAQAGISKEMAPTFCRILEKLVAGKSVTEAMEEIKSARNELLAFAAEEADHRFLKELLLSAKEIMRDCQSGEYTEAELRGKYQITSSRLIHTCWRWVRKQGQECA